MTRGPRPLARALVMALVLGVPLAGCAPGGPDRVFATQPAAATTPATVSAPATPSPSPTAFPARGPLPDGVAPARPAALDEPPTLEGAKAVATYFLLLYSYTYQTGDAAPWIALSDPRCVFCSGVIQKAQTQQSEGQRLVGGAIQVTATDGTEVDPAKFFDLTLSVTQAPSKTVDVTGTAISQTAGGDRPANVIVINDGTWHIREISINPRGAS